MALAAIRTLRNELGDTVPMVAVFDTTFHRTLPPHAGQYAIPHELTERLAIRRYGFHGIAHRSMVEQYAATTNSPLDQTRIITFQLGNGARRLRSSAARASTHRWASLRWKGW